MKVKIDDTYTIDVDKMPDKVYKEALITGIKAMVASGEITKGEYKSKN